MPALRPLRPDPEATGPHTIAEYEAARRAARSCPPHAWTKPTKKVPSATCATCGDTLPPMDTDRSPAFPPRSTFRPTPLE